MTARLPLRLFGRGLLLGLAATVFVMGADIAPAAHLAQDGDLGSAQGHELPAISEEPRWHSNLEAIGLPELLTVAQSVIYRPIEFDPKAVQGEARLGALVGYTAEELWRTINVELAQRGLATVQTPGTESLRVVEAARAFQMARIEASDLKGATAGYLRVLVVLEHARAADLVPTLQALTTKDIGRIQIVAERNALLLGDHRPELEQTLALLRLLDVGASPPEMFEFMPRHAAPLALKGLVEQVALAHGKVVGTTLRGTLTLPPGSRSVLVVAPKSEMAWWRSTVEHFDRRESSERVEYRPRRFGLTETARLIEQVVRGEGMGELPGTWRVVEDRLTGTLFVTATPSQHVEITRLLARLEAVDQGPQRPMRTFEVRNRQVKEVLELLRGLLDAGVLDQPVSWPATSSPTGARGQEVVQGPTAPIPTVRASSGTDSSGARDVVLTADEPTGRILAIGEGRLLDQIAILIETLDVRHPQVLIEALVVSLTERETRSLGVELQRHLTSGDAAIRLASLFGLGSPDPANGALGAAGGTGFSGVVLDPRSAPAQLALVILPGDPAQH
jgi:type II secretory pathway component GspD/PulD (secretin)